MSQVLRLGIIAAGLQLPIVTLVLCFVSLSSLREFVIPVTKPAAPDAGLAYLVLPLKWLLVLVAVGGIALTDTRFSAFAARRIRHDSRLIKPADPNYEAEKLLALCGFSALGCAIFTLEQPPDFIITLGRWFTNSTAAYTLWSGFMSLGVAHFGAIAYAAWRAVRAVE
jgi:hypothetical protein